MIVLRVLTTCNCARSSEHLLAAMIESEMDGAVIVRSASHLADFTILAERHSQLLVGKITSRVQTAQSMRTIQQSMCNTMQSYLLVSTHKRGVCSPEDNCFSPKPFDVDMQGTHRFGIAAMEPSPRHIAGDQIPRRFICCGI